METHFPIMLSLRNEYFFSIMKQEFIRPVFRVKRKSKTDLFHGTVDFISESTSERRY